MTAEKGQDCTVNSIVCTESECKKAATQLQLTYDTARRDKYSPAGCYRWYDTVYFNQITNPSLTDPSTITAGICKGITIYFLFHQYIQFNSVHLEVS